MKRTVTQTMHRLIFKFKAEARSINQDQIECNTIKRKRVSYSNKSKKSMPVLTTQKKMRDNPKEKVNYRTITIIDSST